MIIQEVTRELAESFDMATAHGALISRILPDSPAAQSSLEVGDIIVSFNEQYVDKSSSLPPLVGQVRANNSAKVEVIRKGESIQLDVVIGELPGSEELASRDEPETAKTSNKLGIEVAPVDDELRSALSLDTGEGVVVAKVGDGPAKLAGIREGDVLTLIDSTQIETVEDFDKAMEGVSAGTSIAVLVQRAQGPIFLALTVE